MLTQERLREVLSYDRVTGDFTYKVKRGPNRVGAIANSRDKDGYILIMIDGRRYRAARLAWLFVYGVWPEGEAEHKNGVVDNNSICNLRDASHAQNMRNVRKSKANTSGLKGAVYHKNRGKWMSQIKMDGKNIYLGCYETAEQAHAAYCEAAKRLHGEFARAA